MFVLHCQQTREVENMTHNEETDQSFKTDTDVKFANKDIRMVIITEYCMFKILLETWMIEKP